MSRFLKNFDMVEKKMAEVEEKNKIRNFQPPVTGDEIIRMYNIPLPHHRYLERSY